jgi:uncharacterized protein YbaR (Trm112 family)
MFIELTDILRCPAPHEEHFLVLLPDGVAERRVESGQLGCLECGRVYPVRGGVAAFGPPPGDIPRSARLSGPAIAALLGLSGPGGYVALVGGAGGDWRGFAESVDGVHIVAVNPPQGVPDGRGVSVVEGGNIPVRARQLRGVVLGPGFADDPAWLADALRTLLPGLRLVGEGATPSAPELEVLASADGVWVARAR